MSESRDSVPKPDVRLLEIYKGKYEHERDLAKATAAFEHAAIKPLFLLNGGALVAFMTFLGALNQAREPRIHFGERWAVAALFVWAAGLTYAAVATYYGYRAQEEHFRLAKAERKGLEAGLRRQADEQCAQMSKADKHGCLGKKYRDRAMAAGAGSLLLFLCACFGAGYALLQ
jgi:hypothetical protein